MLRDESTGNKGYQQKSVETITGHLYLCLRKLGHEKYVIIVIVIVIIFEKVHFQNVSRPRDKKTLEQKAGVFKFLWFEEHFRKSLFS